MEIAASRRRERRLDSLTGARFLAAGLVFLCHIATSAFFKPGTAVGDGLMSATKSAGTIGVSFFFLLSGFVLAWSARPGDTYGGVLRRRLVKVFPNHLVTFALAMFVYAAATPAGTAVLNALLLQAWSSDPMVFLSVNGSSWSLSCELLFYALLPLLLPLVRRISPARLWWWAGGLAAAVMLVPVAAQLIPQGQTFPPMGTWLDGVSTDRMWFTYIFPLTRLLEFVLGILMARIVLSGRWIGFGAGKAALLTVAAYVLGLYTPMLFTVSAVTVVPLALFIAALAVSDTEGTGTPLATAPMRRLGEVSFAFYLVHGIVLAFIGKQLAKAHHTLTLTEGVLVSLLAFAVSTGLALAMYHLIEMPAVRLWSRPRAARTPATGGTTERAMSHSA
ncbi:acyltransferase family protein [Streptomyces sp. NPDC002537]